MAVRDWGTQFKSVPTPSGGFYGTPGYENPLGKDAPSWDTGKYDWKGNSGGTDWNSGFDIDKTGMFEKLFGKAKETEKYRSMAERDRDQSYRPGVEFGEPTGGQGTQLFENLASISPLLTPPMVIEGQPGKRGLGSTIGHIAGTIGGAIIGGPVGGVVAGLGGPIGGLFG